MGLLKQNGTKSKITDIRTVIYRSSTAKDARSYMWTWKASPALHVLYRLILVFKDQGSKYFSTCELRQWQIIVVSRIL